MLAENGSKAFLEVDGDRPQDHPVGVPGGRGHFRRRQRIFSAKDPQAEIEELRSRCTVQV